MQTKQPKTIYRKDYMPPAYLIETVDLHFQLAETYTQVTTKLSITKNNNIQTKLQPLVLDGEALELKSVRLNDIELDTAAYEIKSNQLTFAEVPEKFTLEIITIINPEENTAFEGLYKSSSMLCTQCESEGFRRITYFLDRPDVMAKYTTTIVADKQKYPVLLSNGNPIAKGENTDGTHWITWQDPFPKPCYLFALVAGDLDVLQDQFITKSGRKVSLEVYVEKGDLDKSQHAMQCLKKAMLWDEEVYGREYDLDIYMIVAAHDFNMGAMENKGLNIFNTKYVLANPQIATDIDYENVLGVIGHEYFHNWTGNRVTCQDWFQLSLKEGLTVFRDQEFTADLTSRTVKRITDARLLRTYQYAEDEGPMAHPVRPESYIEINNFYTRTVYEKGAEIIRMQHTILGKAGFRKGMDLYFERHDGQAVTIDDFVKAMEDANKVDLSQFRRWYSQAGTPVLDISSEYDAEKQNYQITIKQSIPAVPISTKLAQPEKLPLHIPLKFGLLDNSGNEIKLDNNILNVTELQQTFTLSNIKEKPILSLLRDFSAPIRINYPYSNSDLMILMMHDINSFSCWEAGQENFLKTFKQLFIQYQNNQPLTLNDDFASIYRHILLKEDSDYAYVAELLTLPDINYIVSLQDKVNIDGIYHVHQFIEKQLAKQLHGEFMNLYEKLNDNSESLEHEFIAKRKLKNTCLHYLMKCYDSQSVDKCMQQYYQSKTMTDRLSALRALNNAGVHESDEALNHFYNQWRHEPLVVDKWFTIQALADTPKVFENVKLLIKHPDFSIANPNRLRSLISAFCCQNLYYFHQQDGAVYAFLADYVIKLNASNPQVASRLVEPLISWSRYDKPRAELMKKQLERINSEPDLSNDVYEVVSKSLNQ